MPLPHEKKQYSYADYMTWGEDIRCEIIDGQMYNLTPAPTPKHQSILGELTAEFNIYLRGKDCRAFAAPIDVCPFADKDTTNENIHEWVQPDLVVVCDKEKIHEKHIVGAPDLVVEILSPSTAKKDRLIKYNKYEKAGVKEYWIVDPYNETIEVYILTGLQYRRSGVYFKDDTLHVGIFEDLTIDLKNVFRE